MFINEMHPFKNAISTLKTTPDKINLQFRHFHFPISVSTDYIGDKHAPWINVISRSHMTWCISQQLALYLQNGNWNNYGGLQFMYITYVVSVYVAR